MDLSLTLPIVPSLHVPKLPFQVTVERAVVSLAVLFAVMGTSISFAHGWIVAYGDAESHLNIAKRVIDSITPGFAQLGGIWLPLPHLLMVPFVAIDPLWRLGLAGSIVAGVAYIATCFFLYKLVFVLTKNRPASFLAFILFALNPNILYIQATPLTEMPLIAFFIISSYFFIRYLENKDNLLPLLYAAFFGFCASLSRYDGWFLVCIEAAIIGLSSIRSPRKIQRAKAHSILYGTLAFFGVGLWLLWGYLILGDPLYFTHSQFSAKSQQANWLSKGELPAYHNIVQSVVYYTVTTIGNTGVIIFFLGVIGLTAFLVSKQIRARLWIILLLFVPYSFYVLTLYLGQSVIFIPSVTPSTFEWRLFNVRYGTMMIPVIAIFVGYLYANTAKAMRYVLIGLLLFQAGLFAIGYEKVITLADGTQGLSRAKIADAQYWIDRNYDGGLVLIDDYARSLSILRTHIPMQSVIYIGNKPYWQDSLVEPQKYARWVVLQKGDAVWQHVYENPVVQGRLYKYFNKAYTSPEILIFKRNDIVDTGKRLLNDGGRMAYENGSPRH